MALACLSSALIFLSGCGCKQTDSRNYKITLQVWGLFDDSDAFQDIFNKYKAANPRIANIEYRKLSPDTYQKDLVEAMASGNGPDIFIINNNWATSFQDKMAPAPATVINEQRYQRDFVDVAAQDFIIDGNIYAVPLSVDSLALYYNKDLFNEAGITTPPKNWGEFTSDVQKLTKINAQGEIIQSGVAMGTAYNINRSTDLLNLLFMQNKTEMIDAKTGRVNFGKSTAAQNALTFYTQFASSGSAYYSWNSNLHYSTDAFGEGKLAMMLNYSWQVATIKSKAPKLNFAVTSVPQFENSQPINFANYWGWAVAKNKTTYNELSANKTTPITNETRQLEDWYFLRFLTLQLDQNFLATLNANAKSYDTTFDAASDYLSKTGKPAARRDLIDKQKDDPWLGVFATGNLLDKNWTQKNPQAVESTFAQMIDQINRGQASIGEALNTANNRLNQ